MLLIMVHQETCLSLTQGLPILFAWTDGSLQLLRPIIFNVEFRSRCTEPDAAPLLAAFQDRFGLQQAVEKN